MARHLNFQLVRFSHDEPIEIIDFCFRSPANKVTQLSVVLVVIEKNQILDIYSKFTQGDRFGETVSSTEFFENTCSEYSRIFQESKC